MKNKIFLILENIRSKENVGSILRTVDAAGVAKVYLCGFTPRPPDDKISKTALGAETWLDWEHAPKATVVIKELNKSGVTTVGLETGKKSENIFDMAVSGPLALVVGNEVDGISPAVLKLCKKRAAIPMYGRKESLNVAVAAGIAVYALRNK